MKDPRLYLIHIIECIERIDRYTQSGQVDLEADGMVYDAVLRNLQTLSEATQRLPDDIKAEHPDIPWQRISGFRNILVHDYLGNIDATLVKRVIDDSMPSLKKAVQIALKQRQQTR